MPSWLINSPTPVIDMLNINLESVFLQSVQPLTAIFALLAAVLSGIAAWLSYRLAQRIRDELKSDEVIVAGALDHPSLSNPDHENCVLQTSLFNKSKRKCVVTKVQVFDGNRVEIPVDWADTIDGFGNPQDRAQLIGIVDKTSLCIRRRDGVAFRTADVHITHTFNTKPLMLAYEMAPGWQEYFAKH